MKGHGKLILGLGLALVVWGQGRAEADEFASIRYKLEACFACHGENGASTQPEYPILAGQHQYYLYVQMKDFKAGRREDPVKKEIMAELSKNDMLVLAEFFSEQRWPNLVYTADPVLARRGRNATDSGQCVQCHLGGYEGNSRIPRLAGQHAAYLKKTMLDFKSKARRNAPAISTLMESFSVEDIAGMAEYLGEMVLRRYESNSKEIQ